MNFMTVAVTDIGIKKNTNQDSALIKVANTDLGRVAFCVVCDGMGGLAKGELASATLIKEFSDWFIQSLPALLYKGINEIEINNQWADIIQKQNLKIMGFGKSIGVNLGTTLTALLIFQNRYYIVNVGDSRAYAITDTLNVITKDQTLMAREIELGNMTPEEAKNDPRKNVLLQCVGASQIIVPDFFAGNFQAGTVFMLCSDGFRHEITDDEIYNSFAPAFMKDKETMEANAKKLVELNKQRAEMDNITVTLIKTF